MTTSLRGPATSNRCETTPLISTANRKALGDPAGSDLSCPAKTAGLPRSNDQDASGGRKGARENSQTIESGWRMPLLLQKRLRDF
eukprot:CAMPEP_0172066472 /NCGR_PEP_ID=MMETSP1043-20130122/11177_1 /TAXON_ID=464988 /ORGANISM="Hemiselmis andersenii, Strain CCMP441" /LENGTH=84 /DNA_ID=CAMNT_0012726629 /DNA_START=778 /DNA_END=1033 /DNA_ORIENTATION=+